MTSPRTPRPADDFIEACKELMGLCESFRVEARAISVRADAAWEEWLAEERAESPSPEEGK